MAGEKEPYEIIMRRYNQRRYRVARSILREDDEAEDVVQDAYVRAYQHLDQFLGRARFSTWLTKIALHAALARVQKRGRTQGLEAIISDAKETALTAPTASPEHQASETEMGRLLNRRFLVYRTITVSCS